MVWVAIGSVSFTVTLIVVAIYILLQILNEISQG